MYTISIDGACRRNGAANCVAAGGAYIYGKDRHEFLSNYEIGSTSQRGEMLALIDALQYIKQHPDDEVHIITDSEYLFNALTKEWYVGWMRRNWLTSLMEPVKNRDMWEKVVGLLREIDTEILFYHVKGHCIPFGKVTANKLLSADATGLTLKAEVEDKFIKVLYSDKADKLEAARELSIKNNGFTLEDNTLKRFVVMNVMADIAANRCVDAADALMV